MVCCSSEYEGHVETGAKRFEDLAQDLTSLKSAVQTVSAQPEAKIEEVARLLGYVERTRDSVATEAWSADLWQARQLLETGAEDADRLLVRWATVQWMVLAAGGRRPGRCRDIRCRSWPSSAARKEKSQRHRARARVA